MSEHSDEQVTLTPEERTALKRALRGDVREYLLEWVVYPAVERIVAERLTAVEALHQGMHHCGSDWWTDNPTYRGSIANKGLCPTRRALRIRPEGGSDV